MPPFVNQRAEPRVAASVFVKATDGTRQFMLRTRDVSATGMFVYPRSADSDAFEVGTDLRLDLYDYDRFVSCRGVVVRRVASGSQEQSRYPVGYGVRIVAMDAPNRARFGEMLCAAA